MRFHLRYFIYTALLFITEVLIALYVKDNFVRPYLGDVLVVLLMYYFFRAFFKVKVVPTAIGILLFSFFIEGLQYFDFVNVIGVGHIDFFRIVIGNSFSWADMICYFVGFLIILLLERKSI